MQKQAKIQKHKKKRKEQKQNKEEKHKNISNIAEKDNNNIVKLCTFSPYRKRRRSKRQTLLQFNGMVTKRTAKFQCKTLVDSGCEETVISKLFADNLQLKRVNADLSAELWNGTLI